jgi:hypothetical protein
MTLASKITKHILLPTYKRIREKPVFAVLEDLQKAQWQTPIELQDRQWRT